MAEPDAPCRGACLQDRGKPFERRAATIEECLACAGGEYGIGDGHHAGEIAFQHMQRPGDPVIADRHGLLLVEVHDGIGKIAQVSGCQPSFASHDRKQII